MLSLDQLKGFVQGVLVLPAVVIVFFGEFGEGHEGGWPGRGQTSRRRGM